MSVSQKPAHRSFILGAVFFASFSLSGCEERVSLRFNSAGGSTASSSSLGETETSSKPGSSDSGDASVVEVPELAGVEDDQELPSQDGGKDPALCDNPSRTQVKICHIPEGNPSAKHTICVGLNGAVYGHGVSFNNEEGQGKGGHGGDYLGECRKD